MKTAVIITPFDNYSYNVRIKFVERCLQELGYQEIIVISSDWDHRSKQLYNISRDNLELIHVPPYKRNISLNRIISHFVFARKVYQRLKEINPDFIYASVPPNFIVRYTAKYQRHYPKVKMIYDLGDLWPETLPVSGLSKKVASPLLGIWSYLRDHYIHNATGIIYECNLFKNIVDKKSKIKIPVQTIHLCKENAMLEEHRILNNLDVIQIAYIGSINNLIDIDLVIEILTSINKKRKVLFHIIGDGENAKRLFTECTKNKIDFINYGKVYDENIKSTILKECTFGINIMKESVMVGATMKSLEYFHWGLAVINNIPEDTQEIIRQYECGYNLAEMTVESLSESIGRLSLSDALKMCYNSRKAYLDLFDESVFSDQFKTFYTSIVK